MSRALIMAIAALGLLARPVSAAEPPAETPPQAAAPAPADSTTVEGLVITARPTPPAIDTVSAFVAEVSAPSANGRLARWDRKICPGVVGLKAPYGQALVDRVAAVSAAVGLEPGAPGCRPNMVIIATDDSQALARSVVDSRPAAFARRERGMSRGDRALKAFVETPAPVRWWHVTRTRTAEGESYTQGSGVRVRSASRLRATTRDDFDHVIIMVDVRRIGVIRFEALADYITMIGLAQIEPDIDLGKTRSILGLFAARDRGAEPVDGLTEWDAAYLLGLYGANRDVVRGSRQEREIAQDMLRRLGPKPASEPGPPVGP